MSVYHRTLSTFIPLLLTTALFIPQAAHAAAKVHTNSIGMEFILIPDGTFRMGSNENDHKATKEEKPSHKVTISKPFYLGKTEVTQAQWEAVMGSSPYTLPQTNSYYDMRGMAGRISKPENPATVSWHDAQEFVKRLNSKEGHNRYRLPTEAEWEYAARAGTTTAYSFGDDAKQLGRYAWYNETFATGSTHPVAQKRPNPWGLFDIHGNAWEWVQDWFDKDYYSSAPPVDPQGPQSGTAKVVRGGSWHHTSSSWRSAYRRGYYPNFRGISIGFRLALSVE